MSEDQGSPQWFADRCGCATASRMADVLATIKNGEAASRANYRAELIAQRLTGIVEPGYTTPDMERGTEMEPFARAAYELKMNTIVEEVGFIRHPSIEWSGASPDGLVGTDGLVEIKAPKTSTHIGYLLAGIPPAKYIPQMAWQCACTGRKWCDFASYDPRLSDGLKLFVVRYTPTPEKLAEMEAAVKVFITEIDVMLAKLNHYLSPRPLTATEELINVP